MLLVLTVLTVFHLVPTFFWNATWLWALAVGVLTWGLMFWCLARYRAKKGDNTLPPQMQYNVPLEILYTVVPIVMVAVLFGKTVGLENKLLDTSQKPDVTINVVGKQWSWDFNYADEKVYETGVMSDMKFSVPRRSGERRSTHRAPVERAPSERGPCPTTSR